MLNRMFFSRFAINSFEGKHAYLSDDYVLARPISEYVCAARIRYFTVSHALVGMQLGTLSEKLDVLQTPDPRNLPEIEHCAFVWDIYLNVLRQKFQCPELRKRLIQTGHREFKVLSGWRKSALNTVRSEAIRGCYTIQTSNPFLGIGENSVS